MPLINYDFSKGNFDNSPEAVQRRERRERLQRVAGRMLTMLRINPDIAQEAYEIVGTEMNFSQRTKFPADSEGQDGSLGAPQIP